MNSTEKKAELQQKAGALQQRVDAIKHDMQQAHSPDFAEQATERENDEVLQELLLESKASLQSVNHALARIDEGSYGLCIRCGEAIDEQRLSILPEAETCIYCADITGKNR